MPSFKVGARGEGAIAALLDIVQERKKENKEREKALRDWNLDLMKRGILQMLENRDMEAEFDADGIWTGRLKKVSDAFSRIPRDKTELQRELLHTAAAPSSAFEPMAQTELEQTTPTTPFVPGPEGSFITGSHVESLPDLTIPRQHVIAGQTPSLAESLRQRRMTQLRGFGEQAGLLESPTRQLLDPSTGQLIRSIPRDAVLGRSGSGSSIEALAAEFGDGVEGGGEALNPRIVQRIAEARAKGISDSRIANDLRAKGFDPATYGVQE